MLKGFCGERGMCGVEGIKATKEDWEFVQKTLNELKPPKLTTSFDFCPILFGISIFLWIITLILKIKG